MHVGEQALAAGLVDQLGGLQLAVELAKEAAGLAAKDEYNAQVGPSGVYLCVCEGVHA